MPTLPFVPDPSKSHKDNYHFYLGSNAWKERSRACIAMAGNKCQLCSNRDSTLTAHHNSYDNLFNEPPEDLVCLCWECHERFHKCASLKRNVVAKKLAPRKTPAESPVATDKPIPAGHVRLTREMIMALRTDRGGFLSRVVARLGEKKMQHGWLRRLVGTVILESDYNEIKEIAILGKRTFKNGQQVAARRRVWLPS